MPELIVLTWDQLDALVARLAIAVGRSHDVVLAVSRGGLVPAGMLAYRLELRDILVASVEFYRSDGGTHPEPRFLQFPHAAQLAGRRVLIVDEVWETGETMEAVAARVRDAGGLPQTAVLHFKPGRSRVDGRPDHWAAQVEDWVRYPYKAGA